MVSSLILEQNKRVVRRVYEEFTNQRDLDLAGELFGPNFVDHGSPAERTGIEGVKETTRLFLDAFPDFSFQLKPSWPRATWCTCAARSAALSRAPMLASPP